jgi:hypothetical protein
MRCAVTHVLMMPDADGMGNEFDLAFYYWLLHGNTVALRAAC